MFTKDSHGHIALTTVPISIAASSKLNRAKLEAIHTVGLRNDLADVHVLERNPQTIGPLAACLRPTNAFP